MTRQTTSRREFLWRAGGGLGGIALAQLVGAENLFADENLNLTGASDVTRVKPAPGRARAKRVIQLFMNGGASQCDLFDYKPQLIARHGQKFDPGLVEIPLSVDGTNGADEE
jgi:hypothetical protein